MDMPEVGIAVSGTAVGALATLVAAWIRTRARGNGVGGVPRRVEVTPDPLRVEVREQYATKRELHELEERWERRITQTLGEIRGDIVGLRKDLKDFNDAAETRTSATHKRIDGMKDFCLMRSGGCKSK